MKNEITVYTGEELARYHFGADHPFGPARHDAFVKRFRELKLDQYTNHGEPVKADRFDIERFHIDGYIEEVVLASEEGEGYIDPDTPAVPGIYEAAATVVGTGLHALEQIMQNKIKKAFIPIGGLHHAYRHKSAGFCVFNDCGVVIETLREVYGIKRVAYIDIDAHHGDGVFYSFETDPDLCFVDVHQDGRHLYPGTGYSWEFGKGGAEGTKLNIPMEKESDDEDFLDIWPHAENFIEHAKPEFILLQCGADSLKGDPLTNLHYSEKTHAYVTQRLCKLAEKYSEGRLLAWGGGGYNLENIAKAWNAVVLEIIKSEE